MLKQILVAAFIASMSVAQPVAAQVFDPLPQDKNFGNIEAGPVVVGDYAYVLTLTGGDQQKENLLWRVDKSGEMKLAAQMPNQVFDAGFLPDHDSISFKSLQVRDGKILIKARSMILSYDPTRERLGLYQGDIRGCTSKDNAICLESIDGKAYQFKRTDNERFNGFHTSFQPDSALVLLHDDWHNLRVYKIGADNKSQLLYTIANPPAELAAGSVISFSEHSLLWKREQDGRIQPDDNLIKLYHFGTNKLQSIALNSVPARPGQSGRFAAIYDLSTRQYLLSLSYDHAFCTAETRQHAIEASVLFRIAESVESVQKVTGLPHGPGAGAKPFHFHGDIAWLWSSEHQRVTTSGGTHSYCFPDSFLLKSATIPQYVEAGKNKSKTQVSELAQTDAQSFVAFNNKLFLLRQSRSTATNTQLYLVDPSTGQSRLSQDLGPWAYRFLPLREQLYLFSANDKKLLRYDKTTQKFVAVNVRVPIDERVQDTAHLWLHGQSLLDVYYSDAKQSYVLMRYQLQDGQLSEQNVGTVRSLFETPDGRLYLLTTQNTSQLLELDAAKGELRTVVDFPAGFVPNYVGSYQQQLLFSAYLFEAPWIAAPFGFSVDVMTGQLQQQKALGALVLASQTYGVEAAFVVGNDLLLERKALHTCSMCEPGEPFTRFVKLFSANLTAEGLQTEFAAFTAMGARVSPLSVLNNKPVLLNVNGELENDKLGLAVQGLKSKSVATLPWADQLIVIGNQPGLIKHKQSKPVFEAFMPEEIALASSVILKKTFYAAVIKPDGQLEVRLIALPNRSPVASADQAATDNRTAVTVDVLKNDVDPDEDQLVIVSADAKNGQAVITTEGQLRYSAKADFIGEDVVIYRIQDTDKAEVSAELRINVTAAPVVKPDPIAETKSSGGALHWIWFIGLVLLRRKA